MVVGSNPAAPTNSPDQNGLRGRSLSILVLDSGWEVTFVGAVATRFVEVIESKLIELSAVDRPGLRAPDQDRQESALIVEKLGGSR